MSLSDKANGVIAVIREQAAKFGRNKRPEDAAKSLTVLSNRCYTIERAVVTEMATLKPEACGPQLRAALTLPASKWSEVNAVEFLALADACEGKDVEVEKPSEVVAPMKFNEPAADDDDEGNEPAEGQ